MTSIHSAGLTVNVVELNQYAPRPYVFTDVALCLRDSIRAAGFASSLLVNQTDPNAICIVLGALPPHHQLIEQLDPRKTVVFNFEQFGSSSALIDAGYFAWLRGRWVADYHSSNVDFLKRVNGQDQTVFELPVVPSPSIRFPGDGNDEKSVDVLFYGTLSERRRHIVDELRAAGLTVETVAGAYGHELTAAILRARVVFHVHFYETQLFPVARVLQPVVHGVPIVCESSVFSKDGDWSRSGIAFADYDNLVAACERLIASPDRGTQCADRTRTFAAGIDFKAPFTALLTHLLRSLAGAANAAPAFRRAGESNPPGY